MWLGGSLSIEHDRQEDSRLLVMAEEQNAVIKVCFDDVITVADYSQTYNPLRKG